MQISPNTFGVMVRHGIVSANKNLFAPAQAIKYLHTNKTENLILCKKISVSWGEFTKRNSNLLCNFREANIPDLIFFNVQNT